VLITNNYRIYNLQIYFMFYRFFITLLLIILVSKVVICQNAEFYAPPKKVVYNVDSLLSIKQTTTNPVFKNMGKAIKGSGFGMKGYWIWDGGVVKGEDGKYHMFCSRWPDTLLMHPAWMATSEIIHCIADSLAGPYTFVSTVFTARGSQYWDGRSTFNPQVQKYNGKYYMFYTGSTHPFEEPNKKDFDLYSKWCIVGFKNKRVGIAVADNVNGPWKRFDKPIIDVEPNTFYSFYTSNPTAVIHKDGSVLVMFKGRPHVGNNFGNMSLGVAYAKNIFGPYTVLNTKQPIFDEAVFGEQEDPFMWKDAVGYNAVFKDHIGKFTGERGAGVLIHSTDGKKWTVNKDPKAWSKAIEWNDGTRLRMGQLERPFIYFENNQPKCFFFSTMDGQGGFNNGTYAKIIVIPFLNNSESKK